MSFIIRSKRLSLSYMAHGAIETYENGILVYVGDTIFPISKDVAHALSYYLGERGDSEVLPFETLGGMVSVPEELALEWSSISFDIPLLCQFVVAQTPSEDGWLLCYHCDLDDVLEETELVKAVLLGDDEFTRLVQDCDSYCSYSGLRGINIEKAWIYRGVLPTSRVIVASTRMGLDLVFPHGTIFSTSGDKAAGLWVRFVIYAREMFDRPTGSFRRFIRFGKVGSCNMERLVDGIKVSFYQCWPNAGQADDVDANDGKKAIYVGSMRMLDHDLEVMESLFDITDEAESSIVASGTIPIRIVDEYDDEYDDEEGDEVER